MSSPELFRGCRGSGGEPADPETVTQITAAARELAGCLNAADWPRWLALMTYRWVPEVAGSDGVDAMFAVTGTPVPGEHPGMEIAWVRVSEVRLLEDGRVGAVVAWGVTNNPRPRPSAEANFHIFQRVGDRWLLDQEIGGNVEEQAKFSIAGTVMVGFVGDDDLRGVSCEMFTIERGEDDATVSAFCRAEVALVGRAAYLDVEASGPHRGNDGAVSRCEDAAPLAATVVFSCTVDLPASAQ